MKMIQTAAVAFTLRSIIYTENIYKYIWTSANYVEHYNNLQMYNNRIDSFHIEVESCLRRIYTMRVDEIHLKHTMKTISYSRPFVAFIAKCDQLMWFWNQNKTKSRKFAHDLFLSNDTRTL